MSERTVFLVLTRSESDEDWVLAAAPFTERRAAELYTMRENASYGFNAHHFIEVALNEPEDYHLKLGELETAIVREDLAKRIETITANRDDQISIVRRLISGELVKREPETTT